MLMCLNLKDFYSKLRGIRRELNQLNPSNHFSLTLPLQPLLLPPPLLVNLMWPLRRKGLLKSTDVIRYSNGQSVTGDGLNVTDLGPLKFAVR